MLECQWCRNWCQNTKRINQDEFVVFAVINSQEYFGLVRNRMAFDFYKARTFWDVGEMVFSLEILATSDCSPYGMDGSF